MRERLSMRVVPRLLWIDGSGALVAGVIVLLFAPFLSGLHALPRSLLLVTGVANLAYGAFSFTLARRARRPMALVQVLAVANVAWGVACMVTAAIVAALGVLEWRYREQLAVAQHAIASCGIGISIGVGRVYGALAAPASAAGRAAVCRLT